MRPNCVIGSCPRNCSLGVAGPNRERAIFGEKISAHLNSTRRRMTSKGMAERVGFEPTVRFPVRSLSRRVLLTAQSPLRGRFLKISRSFRATEPEAEQGVATEVCAQEQELAT